jgi:hypothetical protein
MSARDGRRPLSISPVSLVLGAGASAAVATAALTGHHLSTPEVVGALSVAGVAAVVNIHHREYEAQPHALRPVPAEGSELRVLAPKASAAAATPAASSDAA